MRAQSLLIVRIGELNTMEKFKLDKYMEESIEYFRDVKYMSLYGILDAINSENKTDSEFYAHGQKVLKHFDDFENKSDNENFMKCLLGYYKVVESRFRIVCPVCKNDNARIYTVSIECRNCGFIELV